MLSKFSPGVHVMLIQWDRHYCLHSTGEENKFPKVPMTKLNQNVRKCSWHWDCGVCRVSLAAPMAAEISYADTPSQQTWRCLNGVMGQIEHKRNPSEDYASSSNRRLEKILVSCTQGTWTACILGVSAAHSIEKNLHENTWTCPEVKGYSWGARDQSEIERFSVVIEKITSELVRLNSLMCTGLHKHFYMKLVNVLVPESWTTSSAAFMLSLPFPSYPHLPFLSSLQRKGHFRTLLMHFPSSIPRPDVPFWPPNFQYNGPDPFLPTGGSCGGMFTAWPPLLKRVSGTSMC